MKTLLPTPDGPLPHLIGHRGVAGLAPENTLAGIARAAELGLRTVEIDARLTSDGGLVLIHDATLERMTGLAARVRDVAAAAIGELPLRHRGHPLDDRIPRLEDALDACEQLGLAVNVELKTEDDDVQASAEALVTCLRRLGSPQRRTPILVSSFAWSAVATVVEQLSDVKRGLLMETVRPDWASALGRLEASVLACENTIVLDEIERIADALGPAGLWVYTVNDRSEALELRARGVDAIFTDRPDRMLPAA